MKLLSVLCGLAMLGGCAVTAEGVRISPPPPPVQGANDAQGAPLSGAGIGSGKPSGPGGSGAADDKPSR